MSVLEIYIHWANSLLAEIGGRVDGVETLQDGKVLCELIDILDPSAELLQKVKASGDCTALAYINTALQHMSSHGIPIRFPAEDIIQNDVKTMLDVMWILILNYGIHSVGETAQHRSIGIGKKNILEWCQEKLNTTFDPKDTLTFSLCKSNWFIKLLEQVTHHRVQQLEDKTKYIDALLTQIQDQHLIKKDIINAMDIVDGTVDEHSLMIYLSLLKRREQSTNRFTNGSQRSKTSTMTPSQEFKEKSENQDKARSDESRSNYDKSVPSGDFYDHTYIGGTSAWSLQFSESDKLLSKQLESFQNSSTGNVATSRIVRDKFVEQLPQVSIENSAGKETETQMISEKETDTLSEFSSLSPIRERFVSVKPSVSLEIKYATGNTNQNGVPSLSNSNTAKHNSSENASRTYHSTTNKADYSGTNQIQTDQHNWKMQERTYRDYPRADNIQIRIKRPKDYIRQWEDTIDRLSTVSVTDEFGSPRSPLISRYNVTLPVRSKSLETVKSTHRNPNRPTSTSFKDHYTLGSRSRSMEVLPAVTASIQELHTHSSNIDPFQNHGRRTETFPERGTSGVEDFRRRYDQISRSSHLQPQDFSKVSSYKIQTEAVASKEEVTLSRDLHSTVLQDSISTQTILKRRDRFEPPSSGSRVHYQEQSNILPHEQQSVSERSQLRDLKGNTSATIQRVHSLSPQKQTVSSYSFYGENGIGSDTTISVPARSRFTSSHHSIPTTREPEPDTKVKHFDDHSEDTATSTVHIQSNGVVLNNLYSNARILVDSPPSLLNAANISTGASIIEYPQEGSTSYSKITSQRLPQNTDLKNVHNLDVESDLDTDYVGHLTDGRDDSPPPVRRGVSRVPRREAWERDRRRKEDLPLIDDEADIVAQSRNIEMLNYEVEVLKEKVENLEEGGTVHRLSRQNRSPSATNTKHNSSVTTRKIIDEINQMAAVEQIKASLNTSGHERAFSCPLLHPSRRSNATRSLSRSAADSRTSETKTQLHPEVTIYLKRNDKTRSSNPKYSTSSLETGYGFNHQTGINNSIAAHKVRPETWDVNFDSAGCLEPNKLEKLKWLVSRHDLSEYEISELKQSLASLLAENDILQTKLANFRNDIHDKFKHTNRVLDDCRHHLAKTQAQNMELRTVLEQEKQKSEAYCRRIKELETSLSEIKADNEQLENDLDQTSTLLNHSVNMTKPGVDALKLENSKLISMLVNSEHENFDLREEIHILKQNQTKAVNTMEDLRECLFKVRRERQELFRELASLQNQEQTARVRKIISNYQEKGTQDEWEREQDLMEERRRIFFDYPNQRTQYSPDSSHFSPSIRNRKVFDHKVPKKSKFCNRESFNCSSWQYFNAQQQSRYDEESSTEDREIYPHRRGYASRSRSYSPHHKGRSSSTPGCYSPVPLDKSFPDYDWPERFNDTERERQQFGESNFQYSQPALRLAYSPEGHRKPNFRSHTPSRSFTQSPQRSIHFKPHSAQYKLNRSFSSFEDLNERPFQHTPDLSKFKSRNRSTENQSSALRNQSPHNLRFDDHGFHRSNHSSFTHGPTIDTEKQISGTKMKRRPLHTKSEAGEITRIPQKEFESEDKRITSLCKSKSQNRSWFELQSESDGEDTGINSSMSSRSSCDHTYMRKKLPNLSDEQRRYADELIKKYTGIIPLKQVV